MSEAIEKLQDEFKTQLAEFQKANDEALEGKAKGIADGIVKERVEKLNESLTDLTDQIKSAEKRAEQAELAAKRNGYGDGDGGERVKAADLNALRALNGGHDVSPEDYMGRKAAIQSYLRKGRESGLVEKAMSVDQDPEGGYYVMPDTSGRIAQLVYETSPIRQVAAIQTITTDSLEGYNDLDEASANWVGEQGTRSETDTPQIGQWRIPVHEQYAEPRATQKLLDDASIDIEAWLAGKVADKFGRTENAAFVAGDGSLRPRGFTTYGHGVPSSSTWNVIERIPTGTSGAFASSNPGDALVDTVFSLKAAYRQGAVWMMNRSTLGTVRKLKDGDGNYMLQPNFTQSGLGLTLLGFPVVEAEDMPDIASNSLSIAFGNFTQGYQIVDRQGVRVLRDPFTAKPYVKFYTTKRVGGDVVNFEALKLVRFASAAS